MNELAEVVANLPAAVRAHVEEVEGLRASANEFKRMYTEQLDLRVAAEKRVSELTFDLGVSEGAHKMACKLLSEVMAKLDAAEALPKRTPGTVEVCPQCKDNIAIIEATEGSNGCMATDCPLRATRAEVE